jgi:hypothetical protein
VNDTFGMGRSGKPAEVRVDHEFPPGTAELARRHAETLRTIEETFTYHAPRGGDLHRYHEIRDAARDFATVIAEHCPESADRTAAFRAIREAVGWANASIALGGISPR